jgi:hypothetical protein
MKSMSDLDKEEEARMAQTRSEKVKDLGMSIRNWVVKLGKRNA